MLFFFTIVPKISSKVHKPDHEEQNYDHYRQVSEVEETPHDTGLLGVAVTFFLDLEKERLRHSFEIDDRGYKQYSNCEFSKDIFAYLRGYILQTKQL